MSLEIHVIVTSVPDLATWQHASTSSGFDVLLDPSLDTARNTGFTPAIFAGTKRGFEYHVSPTSDVAETYTEFREAFGARSLSANFRWGHDLVEMACALASSAGLSNVCGGVWFDPQEGACLAGDEAIDQAKQLISAIREKLSAIRAAE